MNSSTYFMRMIYYIYHLVVVEVEVVVIHWIHWHLLQIYTVINDKVTTTFDSLCQFTLNDEIEENESACVHPCGILWLNASDKIANWNVIFSHSKKVLRFFISIFDFIVRFHFLWIISIYHHRIGTSKKKESSEMKQKSKNERMQTIFGDRTNKGMFFFS